MIPTFLGITLLTFFIMKLAPGDPVALKLMFAGEGLSAEALAAELQNPKDPIPLPASLQKYFDSKKELNVFDRGLKWVAVNTVHYTKWLKNLFKLDFGYSMKDQRPVLTRIAEALPITLLLNILTILIVYSISIPLGIWSARQKSGILDQVVMVKLFILYSLPTFWIATLLLTFFAGGEYLNWFPLFGILSDGSENFTWYQWILDLGWHLFLPLVVSVYGSFAFLARFSRNNFLEVIGSDYIRTARAKGLPEEKVIWKHAFRNSLIPLVTLMGGLLPALLGGSIIIEQIFSIPGMGMLSFEAVLGRDYNLIMGIEAIAAFLTLAGLLISDLLYVVVDPRISFEGQS